MEVRKVRKVGNSLTINVPAEISKNFPEGTLLGIEQIKNGIKMVPIEVLEKK